MADERFLNGSDPEVREEMPAEPKKYSRLFRRFVLLTMVCSLLPLLLTGWGLHLYYTRFAREHTVQALNHEVDHHRKIIELFLKERCAKLQLIAGTLSKAHLTVPAHLKAVFELINRDHWTISDIGVIDADGEHLAYIGPYDLMDKNYADTFWFKAVMDKGGLYQRHVHGVSARAPFCHCRDVRRWGRTLDSQGHHRYRDVPGPGGECAHRRYR